MEKISFVILFLVLLCSCSPDKQKNIPEEIQNLENVEVYPADAVPTNDIRLIRDYLFP